MPLGVGGPLPCSRSLPSSDTEPIPGLSWRDRFTAEAHALWRRARAVLDDLRDDFVADGIGGLWSARDAECTRTLASHEEGRARRWLVQLVRP
jgi:hypothetical protein